MKKYKAAWSVTVNNKYLKADDTIEIDKDTDGKFARLESMGILEEVKERKTRSSSKKKEDDK